jgi:Na+-translocating ferredoxin:NAD+ oxidoreductase subunit G
MSNEHNEDASSVIKVAMNLFGACLVSGLIIAWVYYMTAETAAAKVIELKNESMRSLVADADEFKDVDGRQDWVAVYSKGKIAAYVVPAQSKGYGGKIKMLVAVSTDGSVLNYTILSHNETPGLGDKAGKPAFMSQTKGMKASQLVVTKDPSNKDNVHAISGATITSRAVVKGLKDAVDSVAVFKGGR